MSAARRGGEADGKKPKALRIATQYCGKGGMVYEIEFGTSTVDLHFSREVKDGQPDGWRIEAHDSRRSDAFIVTGSAPTRTEALRLVGETWTARAWQHGLGEFDWNAVAELLTSVRGL